MLRDSGVLVDASAIPPMQYADLEQAATRILRGSFGTVLDNLVRASGSNGDFGRCFAAEAPSMAFIAVHPSRRVLVERAHVYADGVCDADRICIERYALKLSELAFLCWWVHPNGPAGR
jgi:hypothetical protein